MLHVSCVQIYPRGKENKEVLLFSEVFEFGHFVMWLTTKPGCGGSIFHRSPAIELDGCISNAPRLTFPVSVVGFSAAASPEQQRTEYQKDQVFIPGVWPLLQR